MATNCTSVLELTCPPLPVVRMAFIGLGRRGMKALDRYLHIEGTEIKVFSDLQQENLDKAHDMLARDGQRTAADCYCGPDVWKEVCQRPDIDLIYICTEWNSHATIAAYAMRHGKHVAVEVPAATDVASCWNLVKTAEETRRHCLMLENCCYDAFALTTHHMAEIGLLGDITHCEGAYIHDLRRLFEKERHEGFQQSSWMEKNCSEHGGNPYPTHGMGPIGLLLNLHRGDRLDYLVSLTENARTHTACGHINCTLLKTVKGRSILLTHDVTTPRPYSRSQVTCGTHGFTQKYPVATFMLEGMDIPAVDKDAEAMLKKYRHPVTARWGEEAHRRNMSNEMNYVMDCRLIYCLRNGLPLDMDVYDAAEWSCIAELSKESAQNGSRPVAIPDFTSGQWDVLARHRFHMAEK